MGILFGLLTAVSWGGSDFLARFATRRIGTLRTMLYMHLIGLLLLTATLRWLGGWGHLADGSGWHPWAWGLLAGCLNGISTLSLYRSFEIGKMAVVAPLSASYPMLTVLLSLMTGEHLTAAHAAGIGFTLLGVAFVAGGEKPPDVAPEGSIPGDASSGARAAPLNNRRGAGWALCSSAGFGVLFWVLGVRVIPAVGAAPTVWMIRLTCTVMAAAVLFFAKQAMRVPRTPVRWMLLGMGAMDTGAFVLNNFGMQVAQVSVVSVLASLYGAVTVALAATFLRERVSRWQWLGIVFIFAGIFLISA